MFYEDIWLWKWKYSLTLFQAGTGQFDPYNHLFVCSFYISRVRLTKIGDFVSLTIWLVPVRPFLKFIFQNFWKTENWNFLGSSSMSRKLKKNFKNYFLQRFSFFFKLNPYFICFQLSLRYITLLKLKIWSFDDFWIEKCQFWLFSYRCQ